MHKSMSSDIVIVVICFKICQLMTEAALRGDNSITFHI